LVEDERMKWLKWLLIGVAALLLLFAAVSLALASPLRVDRSVAIAAPAGKVPPRTASQAGQEGLTASDRRGPQLRMERAAPDFAAGLDNPKRPAATS
jgi:hypothetical protein